VRVEVDGTIGSNDVTLHVYADTSRTIAFKKVENSYKWIAEQEIHRGPRQRMDNDGALVQESISVDYQTEPWNGIPLNTIWINYTGGDDPRLLNKHLSGLTLQDIKPILEEWRQWRAQQPPLSVSLCP
jgi:hypothetical protein